MSADETPPPPQQSDMVIRVSLGTYKLFYEAGSEDFVWQKRGDDHETLTERAKARQEERRKSRWLLE